MAIQFLQDTNINGIFQVKDSGNSNELLVTDGLIRVYSTLRLDSDIIASASYGTTGQVLTSNGPGSTVTWENLSGGGNVSGSGTSGKMTKWSGASAITDSSHMTEDGTGVMIGGGSPSAKLHVYGSVKFGTDTLYYNHTNQRIGLGTTTPSQLLTVNGGMHLIGAFYDGLNSSGTSGQVLLSTGTQALWRDPDTVAFRENKVFYDSWKIGTTGTMYLDWTAGGSLASLGYANGMVLPYDGRLTGVTVMSDGTQNGFSFALLQQSGGSLWSVTSQTLDANVPKTYTMSTALTKSTHKSVHFRVIRATSSTSNYNIIVTLTFEWD